MMTAFPAHLNDSHLATLTQPLEQRHSCWRPWVLFLSWLAIFTATQQTFAEATPFAQEGTSDANPAVDYLQLGVAEKASSLGLTTEQTTSIQQILTEHQNSTRHRRGIREAGTHCSNQRKTAGGPDC